MLDWETLERACASCRKCDLCEGRTNVVIGRGSRTAEILFVGEGPGQNEDEQGLPFVGKAGELLNLALEGLAYPEESYYIANVVKCRPPKNRNPLPEEAEACMPYLRAQFSLIKPKIVVCLGSIALKNLIDEKAGITASRGQWLEKKGVLFMATYHPAALLRDESKKADFWHDLRTVREKYDELKRN